MTEIFRLSLTVPATAAGLFEVALESLGGALARGVADADGRVRLQLYLGEDPGGPAVVAALAVAAATAGLAVPGFELEPLPELDWVSESQSALPPLRAGRFYLHGSHVTEPPPAASLALRIDAGAAFGTGRHETTKGCLLALGELARRQVVTRALDLGCGSGVLTLALARLWPAARVWGADNDPVAVRVADENARLNGLAAHLRLLPSQGFANAALARAAPFQLIVANILAEPLRSLALPASQHLADHGRILLSGLLIRQERSVLARYFAAGCALERRLRLGDWSTLLLHKKKGRRVLRSAAQSGS